MPKKSYYPGIPCFLFLIFSVVHSKRDCLISYCGNKSSPIHYPFQLGGQQQKGCHYPPFDLKCSNQGVSLLNLPSSGHFYVRGINYSAQTIQLYHPNDCLPGRLMNSINFSSYHLMAVGGYQNCTFFSSRREAIGSNLTTIGCLSNSTLATSCMLRAQEMRLLGCNIIATVLIPVSSTLQDGYDGFDGDLLLTWNVPTCDVCVKRNRRSGKKIFFLVFSGEFHAAHSILLNSIKDNVVK
ncbi:hypothetical protein Pfo_026639 [Paulownia fortunei]|nr:hypothetical protein Pfo_026639 [Paulownia fortunei]